jgi:hypothetical protein
LLILLLYLTLLTALITALPSEMEKGSERNCFIAVTFFFSLHALLQEPMCAYGFGLIQS